MGFGRRAGGGTRRHETVGPRERKLWIGAGVAALAVALVAGIGIVAHGFDRSSPHLSDASVWVANTSTSQLGRANTEISELDTAVKLDGDGDMIAQDQRRVVTHSAQKNTLTVMDPAKAADLGTVNLPEGKPDVVTAGARLGILDTAKGEVWVRSLKDVADYTPGAEPDGQVGSDAVLAVGPDGTWAGYSRTSSRITLSVPGAEKKVIDVDFSGATDRAQISLVGDEPVVYNPTSNEVHAFGDTTKLSGVVDDPASVRLAQPGSGAASGSSEASEPDVAMLAHDGGFVSVGQGKSAVELPVDGMDSQPAAPVRMGECWFGAWSEGEAVQACDGRDPETFGLESADASSTVALRINQDTVVADDATAGKAWALQHGGALISNWDDFNDTATQVQQRNDDLDVPPTPVKAQRPPEAEDDEFGARPGRANVLPVLLNDTDRNADPLAITSVSPPPATVGRVEPVENDQKLQFTPRSDATGTVTFSYTVDDGHGGQDTAKVSVTLVDAGVNHAPEQVRTTRTTVAQDGHATVETLDDWVDPESDPMYLDSATANAPARVGAEASGRLDVTQGGGEPGLDTIRTKVSDGKASGTGQVMLTVTAKGRTPIITENTTLTGRIGTELVTTPTDLARGGDGDLRLTKAELTEGDEDGLETSVVFGDGSVKMLPREAGEYEVTYAVSDGDDSQTGTIRVVVSPVPDGADAPVVAPTTAFVRLKDSTEADVLANAYDPAGGVLSITGIDASGGTGAVSSGGSATGARGTARPTAEQPEPSGIDTEIVDGKKVKITLLKDVSDPVPLTVTVSNGTSTARGQLTLVQIPEPRTLQAPVARDDRVTVRAGDVVDVPVLRNDSHPDGKPLRLQKNLATAPKNGLMVASGDRLRYLAPDQPGTYTARYRVLGPDGREAVGQVEITVTALDAKENRAPSAPSLSARTRAGQAVTIPVDADGADPDGDAVSVSAVVTPPRKGTLRRVDEHSMVYVPNDVAEGTDTFTYSMTDALGASSVGRVRVGVLGRDVTPPGPDAEDDLVTTKPGSALDLDVLGNDSDPFGKGLTITDVSVPAGGAEATTDGRRVRLSAPDHAATVSVLYRVEDARGTQSTAWLTLEVRPDAPSAAPQVQDRTLSLSQVGGRKNVPVDVLSSTTLTEGDASDLRVDLPEGWSDARVDAQGRVVVPVGKERRIIPFTVTRTDAKDASATAFITVPGTDEAPPEIRDDAPELKVTSGQDLDIDLSEQTIAAMDRTVGISDKDAVIAMNGTAEVLDRGRIRFRSEDGYWGPAAVSVPVTDGRTSASLILPITVEPQQHPAPVMRQAQVSVESAQTTTVDLRESTDVAGQDPDRFDGLTWSVRGADSSVATAQVQGHRLRVRAAEGATPGRSTRAQVTVTDEQGRTSTAAVDLTVISSTKPPPLTHDDEVTLRRGESSTVDVTNNDVSPFPGRDLDLVQVRTATPVDGVSIKRKGSRITATADEHAETGTATVVYQVQDATGDPERRAEGVLRVTVQDVPGAPAAPEVSADPADAAVALSTSGAEPNGSAIRRYEYQVDGDRVGTCAAGPRGCRVEGLSYGVDHVFRMRAVNGVGAGAWSEPSRTLMMDREPGVPTGADLAPSGTDRSGHTMNASWRAPKAAPWGSQIKDYTVKLLGPGLPDGGIVRRTGGTHMELKDSRIRAGQEYRLQVVANNRRLSSDPASADATAVAAPRILSARAGLTPDGESAQVEFRADGAGAPTQANVSVKRDGETRGTCSTDGFKANVDGTTWQTRLKPGAEPVFTVRVSNGLFCTKAVTKKVDTEVGKPGGDTWVKKDEDGAEQGQQPYYRIDPGTPSAKHYFVAFADAAPKAGSGAWQPASPGRDRTFGEDGRAVTAWAMNCRTSQQSFCSPPVKLGTETKVGVDLTVTASTEQCVADGEDVLSLKAADGVRIGYRWKIASDDGGSPRYVNPDSGRETGSGAYTRLAEAPVDVEVPAWDEKLVLQTESGADGFTDHRDVLTCGARAVTEPEGAVPEAPGPRDDQSDQDDQDHDGTETTR